MHCIPIWNIGIKFAFSFNFDTVLLKTPSNDIVTICRSLLYYIKFLLRQPAAGKDGKMKNSEKTMDKIVALCKNRGYVYPGSEIYGGLANSWDYGPLGVEFKNNVKKAWLKKFVQESPYNVGLDAAIIMNPQTWITTGHVSSFSDPLLDCRSCKARHRADKLIGEEHHEVNVDAMTFDEMDEFIASHEDIICPVCGKHDFTPIRKFNLMFKTAIGVTEDSSSTCYLRPETAQGIFVNFANIQRTTAFLLTPAR